MVMALRADQYYQQYVVLFLLAVLCHCMFGVIVVKLEPSSQRWRWSFGSFVSLMLHWVSLRLYWISLRLPWFSLSLHLITLRLHWVSVWLYWFSGHFIQSVESFSWVFTAMSMVKVFMLSSVAIGWSNGVHNSLLRGTRINMSCILVYWMRLVAALVRLERVGPATACILFVSSDWDVSVLGSTKVRYSW